MINDLGTVCKVRRWRSARAGIGRGRTAIVLCGISAVLCIAEALQTRKLDPVSEVWVERSRSEGRLTADSQVVAIVETTSVEAQGRELAPGFNIRSCFNLFCTGQIKASAIESLSGAPTIRSIRVSGVGLPIRAAQASVARQRLQPAAGANPTATKPVLVAVIDQGIPWRDPAFWNQFGNRIAWVWDQTDPSGPAPRLLRGTYGTEAEPSSVGRIYAAQPGNRGIAGHGAKMAALAAGLGARAEVAGLMVDLQPAAAVILVNTTGKEAEVFDAVGYVVQKARAMGAHCVINLSMSTHLGPHDGTDLFTRAIDSLLDEDSLLVLSVGNDAGKRRYIRTTVGRNTEVPVAIRRKNCQTGSFASLEIEGWYGRNMTLQFSVGAPGARDLRLVPGGGVDGLQWASGRALLDARLVSGDATKNGVHISGEVPCAPQGETRWIIAIRNAGGANGPVEWWISEPERGDVLFPDAAETGQPISALAASNRAISVGAYVLQSGGGAKPAFFSSAGAAGDGRWKPDLILLEDAPQTSVPEGGTGGTSAAAAIATRCIGFLWGKAPQRSSADIRKALQGRVLLPIDPKAHWMGASRYRAVRIVDLQSELAKMQNTR